MQAMTHEAVLPPREPEEHTTEDSAAPEAPLLPHLFDIYFFGKAPFLSEDNQQQNIVSSFPPGINILEISGGYEWTAVLLENHLVYTWGSNSGGQLGHGQDPTASVMRPTLISSLANIRIVRISCGSVHGGFISESGELYMVGDGRYGRLGTGSSDTAAVPVQIECTYDAVKSRGLSLGIWPTFLDERGMKRDEPTTFADISCGDRHTLVLVRSMLIIKQAVLAFGDGSYGRLGLGTDRDNKDPCLVACYKTSQGIMFPPVQKIHAGQSHSLAVTHTGELYTWGNGGHGRLGHGSEESYWSPKRVESFTSNCSLGTATPIKDAVCGSSHTLALDNSGQVYAWGRGDSGQLGFASMSDAWSPHKIAFADTTQPVCGRQISAGFCCIESFINFSQGRAHSWLIDSKNQVYCWGDNSLGQLGLLPSIPYQPTPVLLSLANVDIGNPPADIVAANFAVGDLYSILVIRRDKSHLFPKQPRDTTMRARTLRNRFTTRIWHQPDSKQVDQSSTTRQPQPLPKWSFHISDPVESLEVPSSMDRFLHMMATTKIAKRMPHLSKQSSTLVVNHKSHAKLATFHLTEPSVSEKQAQPRKPVNVKGLTSWRAKHTHCSNNNSTFSHAARFPVKIPPSPEVVAIAPVIPSTKKTPRSGVFFGLSQRGQRKQSATPGPGTYDVIKHYDRQPLPAAFNSTAPKDLKLTPRDLHEPSQELHPEKAQSLIFPTPPAVKFDSGHDFSKVVQQHLIQGKGSTPGPGAYTVRL